MNTQPITSTLAHEGVKARDQKVTHHRIIIAALNGLRNSMGTASDIALRSNIDYTEVNRRMKELLDEENPQIEIFSEKGGRTSTGNPCRIYRALTAADKNILITKKSETKGALTLF